MVNWIDTFMYNGDRVVELRLEYLYPHVHKFYIYEGRYTHQGERKEVLYFEKNKNIFTPYLDKIIFVETDINGSNSEINENLHRNYITPYILNNETEPFILSVSDCDEIVDIRSKLPNNEIYNIINEHKCHLKMNQKMFVYNFNWVFDTPWPQPFFITDKLLKNTTATLCNFRNGGSPIMIDCGYHLSYFMSIADIIRKLQSFCHIEFRGEKYCNREHIYDCIINGKWIAHNSDISGHNNVCLIKNDDINLPELFYKYISKFEKGQELLE